MNTRPILDSDAGPYALSVSFNADYSCFSVALESGYHIYSSSNGEAKLIREVDGGIGCAEILGTTEYIALVGGGKQPKFPQNKVRAEDSDWIHVATDTYEVQIYNDRTAKVTTALEFKTPVQRVRITRTHLIVVLLNTISIYKMKIPPSKVKEYLTVSNPFGLCALGNGVVVFPGRSPGQLNLFHFESEQISIVNAHSAPLRAVAVSNNGDMVATASEKGTLIRVWSYPSCTKVAEFRRGVDEAAVFSLAFSPNGSILAVTSDKSTLHLFDIAATTLQAKPDPTKHKWGSLSMAGPLLPRQFSDTYSFTSAKFEMGDEPLGWGPHTKSVTFNAGIPGVPGGRPTKGLIGWLDDQTILVIGAGQDARWEKFVLGVDQNGKRIVYREGWRHYLDL
ncbi:WD40 repeat-like protein [Byssothecium circinans]|uniref:WD40 repeat-like protein n=1 Tax=Byssothecium circinans TaxID=147558 RepID=A0A6A5TWU9_9PLEO|nr:WD40 repeat-like protein [Byssothecium circinans]